MRDHRAFWTECTVLLTPCRDYLRAEFLPQALSMLSRMEVLLGKLLTTTECCWLHVYLQMACREGQYSMSNSDLDIDCITHEKGAHERTSGRMLRAILTLRAVFRMTSTEKLLMTPDYFEVQMVHVETVLKPIRFQHACSKKTSHSPLHGSKDTCLRLEKW